jgi:hypothetical protein
MRKYLISLILLLTPALAHAQFETQQFKKETAALESAINGIVTGIVPDFGMLQKSRGTYIEGYGAVFTMEIMLDRAATPFSSPGTEKEVKQNVSRRHKEIKSKISDLLKERFSEMKSVGESGAVTVVIYVMNTNPAYVPDLPGQVVLTARKQGNSVEIAVREY